MRNRFFIILFTLLSLFQPASWAMVNASDNKAGVMDHQSDTHTGHHEMASTGQMAADSVTLTMTHIGCDTISAEMQGQCLIDCLMSCSANMGITAPALSYKQAHFKRHFTPTTLTTFTSYTESPEIQPPLDIRL